MSDYTAVRDTPLWVHYQGNLLRPWPQKLVVFLGQCWHLDPPFTCHTMDLLWEKFQWILPLYIKPISFQSKASVVCSVTAVIFIGFCLKKVNVFSQHNGKKQMNIWIPQNKSPEIECWSTFCVNYFLRYYLMMQHQPVVKRVNGTHEWAHKPYQLLITAACTNTGGKMKISHPRAADRCPFVHRP